jgi:hypothetical protein
LEFIDSVQPDKKYLFPVAERVGSGVRSLNPMQRVLKPANELAASTLHPGGNNQGVSQQITALSMLMDYIISRLMTTTVIYPRH